MLALGLDFETTGLDTKTDRIIEVGAVLWDTKTHQPVMTYGALTRPSGWDGTLTDEIQKLTGITPEMLHKFGLELGDVLQVFGNLIMGAGALIAHNGHGFDFPLLDAEFERAGLDIGRGKERLKVDTAVDIQWPDHVKGRKLGHLAADHGFINPFPHRAVTDVLTMMMVLSHYDFDAILARAKSPNVRLVAKVSFEQKDLAKEAGFYWDAASKEWFKNCKECDLPTMELPFKTSQHEVYL